MLESEICLYSNEIDLLPRLSRSCGTFFANNLEPYTQCYYDGYIPKKPWLPLTDEDNKKLILTFPPQNYLNSIGIGKIPDEIFTLAGKLNINANKPQSFIDPNYENPQYTKLEQALFKYLAPLSIRSEGLDPLGIYCGKKNLPTTTFDFKKNKFIGLHYDSWDKIDWKKRFAVRNRICINLGIEERYFLFVNLEIKTVLQKLADKGISEYNLDEGPYRALFENYPDYPVIKLRLEPGEYYIGPTESMIHDGCTEDKTYNDVTMTILGYFHTHGMKEHL